MMLGEAQSEERFRMRALLPVLALLVFSVVGTAAAALAPRTSYGSFAVISPPWYTAAQTVALVSAAGGTLVRSSDWSNVIISDSSDPQFVSELYRAGAWLVLDPNGIQSCLNFQTVSIKNDGVI